MNRGVKVNRGIVCVHCTVEIFTVQVDSISKS